MIERDKREPSILFLDDEDECCRGLATVLRLEYGYDTVAVTGAYEALELVDTNDFDIAVIDRIMPVLDGIEVVKRILVRDPRVHCCILTAYPTIDSCDKAYRAGIVRYLTKPITAKELHEQFVEILSRKEHEIFPLSAIAGFAAGIETAVEQAGRQRGARKGGKTGGNDSAVEPAAGQAGRMSGAADGEHGDTDGDVAGMENLPELPDPDEVNLEMFKRSAIRRYMLNASRVCNGSPKAIARMAGISLPTAYRLLNEYDIPFDRKIQPGRKGGGNGGKGD